MIILKRIFFVIILLTLAVFAFGANYSWYLQYHAMPDGGYVDTPSFTSRYGDGPQTVYLQLSAEKLGKSFVNINYFESYLETLKKHPGWFSTYKWLDSSLLISEYLQSHDATFDKIYLKSIDRFFEKNLKNYSANPSYANIISDLLIMRKFLGENSKSSPAYAEAINLLKMAVESKVDETVGLTVLKGILNANLPLPKISGLDNFILKAVQQVINNNSFQEALTLLKLTTNGKKFMPLMKNVVDISSPQQLYSFIELSEKLGLSYSKAKDALETLLTYRSPFGGFYNIGTTSDFRDTYWATKLLILDKKTNNTISAYWKNFASNLSAYPNIYPADALSTYIYYLIELNNDLGFLSGKEFQSLSNALSTKLNKIPSAPAYYLAKSDFAMAFHMLEAIRAIGYRGQKLFETLNTTIARLISGLDSIPKDQRNFSYYYIYANLLTFANDLGYPVSADDVKRVNVGFKEFLKKISPPDLNLLSVLFQFEKDYALKINKAFFINAITKLSDPKTGGYFSNVQSGIETFKSTYTAEEMLLELKKMR